MTKNKIQLTICRTCVRDNYGEGIFADIEQVEQSYRQGLKSGLFKMAAEIRLQSCFTQCNDYHCVQVTQQKAGFLLKKISSPEKIHALCDWVKHAKETGRFELPESLQEHLLEKIEVDKKIQ